MLATPSGRSACPHAERQHRLAVQLTYMIPGAATIRVSLNDPTQRWPHPHTIVKDEAGRTIELGRATATVAARWILRAWPEADWTHPYTFDLAEATLTRSDMVAAARGR
ncbi:transcriptional regulator [Streptomyces sp. NBC_00385]|uniref:transcriptional regulator n=1 Tax=Streptomyces sp. NBC_00385 TaxID=2975733 RepID=UPI002DD906F7|nr:transcriptional regulator [Streptomyces sp. NBC_00385]WRZ03645.1 transcriptional regulator [Streptomyces sp. NBC_00385]